MSEKMQPCCAKFVVALSIEERDLRTLARRASRYPESPRWRAKILEQKDSVKRAKQNIVDHEAAHAGELAASA